MKFKEREIKLAIFDLDGTLISSTSVWADVDTKFFKKRGMDVPDGYGRAIAHLGLDKAAKYTKETYFPDENEEDIIKEWVEMVKEEYLNAIELKPYARDILDLLKEKNVHLAVATANSKDLYEPCLKRLGIYELFEYVLDVGSTKEGKNSSEIYDTISSRFNFSKENVMVIEDLPKALKTAFKAGYLSIGIYDSSTSKDDEYMLIIHLGLHSRFASIDSCE